MPNKRQPWEDLKEAVERLHDCRAHYVRTETVHETFQAKTIWKGFVAVFDLAGHPKAKRAYAWKHLDGANDERTRFVAVLGTPPIDSAAKAVQVSIVADGKDRAK